MGSKGLPRIVSIPIEEERALLSNLTFSNRQKLIEGYIPLVKMLIEKYYADNDEEELLSFGLEELIKSIDSFSKSKQNSLYCYTFLRLKKRMFYYLKKETTRKSNEEFLSEEILDNDYLEDIIEEYDDKRLIDSINEYLKMLNEEDFKYYICIII